MTTLTLEEQERRAYISGNTELAKALAGQHHLRRIRELEVELREVNADITKLHARIVKLTQGKGA